MAYRDRDRQRASQALRVLASDVQTYQLLAWENVHGAVQFILRVINIAVGEAKLDGYLNLFGSSLFGAALSNASDVDLQLVLSPTVNVSNKERANHQLEWMKIFEGALTKLRDSVVGSGVQ